MTTMPRARRGGDVDVVDADAGAADHAELRRGVDHARRVTFVPLRTTSPSASAIAASRASCGETGAVHDLDAAGGLEDGEPFAREGIADEHLGHGSSGELCARARRPGAGRLPGETASGARPPRAARLPRPPARVSPASGRPACLDGAKLKSRQALGGVSTRARLLASARRARLRPACAGGGARVAGRGGGACAVRAIRTARAARRARAGARLEEHHQPRAASAPRSPRARASSPARSRATTRVAMREGLARARLSRSTLAATRWRVAGRARPAARARGARVDARDSGTTARFLTAAAALAAGPTVDRRQPRACASGRSTTSPTRSRALGARVEILGRARLPAGARRGRRAAPAARPRSTRGARASTCPACCSRRPARRATSSSSSRAASLVSRPYVDLTLEVMRAFGAEARLGARRGACACARTPLPRRARYAIEPDASSAVYPLCAAAIAGGRVRVEGIPPGLAPDRPRLLDVLERMGCRVARTAAGIARCAARDGRLRGVDVDMNDDPRRGARARRRRALRRRPEHDPQRREPPHQGDRPPRRARDRAAQARRRARRAAPTPSASSPRRSAGARSTPTTTTAWRWPSPSPACASRASRSENPGCVRQDLAGLLRDARGAVGTARRRDASRQVALVERPRSVGVSPKG